MTLLESIIALVILSLSAVGALGIFQGANRAATGAQAWTIAASYAEQGIESAKIGDRDAIAQTRMPNGFSRRVESKPASHGLLDVAVTVGLPGGAFLVVHRLVQPQ